MHGAKRYETSPVPPDIDVRFEHETTCSMAIVRRRDRTDANGYDLRLKSWDNPRAARSVIEGNLLTRVRRAYGLSGKTA